LSGRTAGRRNAIERSGAPAYAAAGAATAEPSERP